MRSLIIGTLIHGILLKTIIAVKAVVPSKESSIYQSDIFDVFRVQIHKNGKKPLKRNIITYKVINNELVFLLRERKIFGIQVKSCQMKKMNKAIIFNRLILNTIVLEISFVQLEALLFFTLAVCILSPKIVETISNMVYI